MIFLWSSYGFPMIFRWFSNAFPMMFLLFSYGFPMISPWFSFWFSTVSRNPPTKKLIFWFSVLVNSRRESGWASLSSSRSWTRQELFIAQVVWLGAKVSRNPSTKKLICWFSGLMTCRREIGCASLSSSRSWTRQEFFIVQKVLLEAKVSRNLSTQNSF